MGEISLTITAPTGEKIKIVIDLTLVLISYLLSTGAEGWEGNPTNEWQAKMLKIASGIVDIIFAAKIILPPLLYLFFVK